MASRPLDHNSTNGSTGLDDILVTPEELHRNDAPDNMDGLELFTNTLFWDLDLARFLDGVDYSRDVGDSTALGSSSNNGSKSYGGSGLSGFEEDFFNAVAAQDPSSILSAPGYDFLNFKFPVTEDQGEHHIPPPPQSSSLQYQNHHPISAVAVTTGSLDGVISPQTTATSPLALIMHRDSSSPASPRSASHLSDFTFPPIGSESSSPPSPQLHLHHHGSTSISEQDAHILSIQESARIAAEEDKRRRNTAASARFRIKKKQRDQAVEKAAKDMADKVSELEKKIAQLELENRWLRNLFVEKNTANSTTTTETKKDGNAGS